MTNSTYKPFGSVTTHSTGDVDFSVNAGFQYKKKNNSEDMMDILNSAVGDFTERPLQIMIREIAKNFLIFTPVGWVILMFILARKYKGKLSDLFSNINVALSEVVNSFGGQRQGS